MSGVLPLSKLILLTIIYYKVCDGFTVSLKNGDLNGEKIIATGLNLSYSYYAFRGIPFAEPPIGSLRFAEPVPKKPWNGTLDATSDGKPCVQKSNPVIGSENCLFLNVYTPIIMQGCALFSVLVYIYGGAFDGGNNTLESNSPDYLVEQNIVVVTINYRLGIFGFASTDDTVVPGNNGLKDQQVALQWVQNNIQQFCGNPNDVTINGQSAGSVSVSYHLQSPASQGLFHKAIMQSGVSLCRWGLSTIAARATKTVGQNLKLNASTSEILIEGLRGVSAVRLQREASSVASIAFIGGNMRDGFAWGPVSEPPNTNQFYSGQSYEILASGNISKVPVLLGYNDFEAGYSFNCKSVIKEGKFLMRIILFLKYDLSIATVLPEANILKNVQTAAAAKIRAFYIGWNLISLSGWELNHFITDDQFVRPIRQFAILLRNIVPVYLYQYSYKSGLGGIAEDQFPGVTHLEEMSCIWKYSFSPRCEQDLIVRNRIVKLWTNFIKYGNPTPDVDPDLQNVTWSVFDRNETYLDIGYDLTLKNFPAKDNMTFWDKFYDTFAQRPLSTY